MNQDDLTDPDLSWGEPIHSIIFLNADTNDSIEIFTEFAHMPIPSEGETIAFHTYTNGEGEKVHKRLASGEGDYEREFSTEYKVRQVSYTYAKGVEQVYETTSERSNEYRVEVQIEEM